MITRTIALAAVAGLIAGPALADGLKPAHAQRIDLPGHVGTAYYTVEASNYLVVATLVGDAPGTVPIRVQAALQNGQSLVLSTPGSAEEAPATFEIRRSNDRLLVTPAFPAN
ncbi:hypothetical protein [Antarcticirhabdus aurantiaca]|uniref:Uncharacterized protein n=1 Tax=Antarcticirhabdus aurantiaca TaxID=2606717 RepID=A0ACD4NPS5_9HYPH|nr:hypothetical protein [Antarcticirhabdus aurantiaca]WAJ28860.1 hypothetical protein OXU80_00995 [Jeongeuplla avenae]